MSPARRRHAILAASIAVSLGLAIFLSLTVRGCVVAGRTANTFAAALHADRLEEASALAVPELRPAVMALATEVSAPSGVADLERADRVQTLRRLRTANHVETVGGWSGRLDVLCGRIAIDAQPGTFVVPTSAWWILRRRDGRWLVADVGSRARARSLRCVAALSQLEGVTAPAMIRHAPPGSRRHVRR